MTLTRMIMAFIVSPVAYILIYMTMLAVFLHFREHEEVSGVMFYMPMYFFYVLVSIPTFFLIRRFYGWTFLSGSVAALLVVIVTEVVTVASTSEDPFSFTRSGSLVLLQP